MPSEGKKRNIGREDIRGIIELCRSVQSRGLNPFLVDVDDLVAILRKYFSEWKDSEDLCLDAEALNEIASVIKLQSEWVKRRSTSLYTDPFLLEEKVRILSKEKIAEVFLQAWHPIAELEQISIRSLEDALRYWENLLPLDERLLSEGSLRVEPGTITREELVKIGILAEEAFLEEMRSLWNELKEKAGEEGRIRYWDFIGSNTYQETVRRAYLTSFLVTYGYATMEIYPLEEEMFLKPLKEPPLGAERKTRGRKERRERLFSIPIPISYEEWMEWRRRQ
ncbi:MAG: hypothetical protein AYL32_005780 [Candidatus Bathyarchaeota archaeon B26-2]|nr:MAG: hypothetical protein AYL32_005780 [Candidatus Bathyarchaeota archaeon B26-2]